MESLNVLVIEKEHDALESASEALSIYGCTVSRVEHGVELTACLAKSPIDIVFIDLRESEEPGNTELRDICDNRRHIPVVAIIDVDDARIANAALSIGVSAILVSPFGLADVAHVLDALGPCFSGAS